ncbi:MAG: hypothetical protein C4293_14940 [Nitrospiraceae bacterium]
MLSRRRMLSFRERTNGIMSLGKYTVVINDGWNFYAICKDIFTRRIYHFESCRPAPFILDCGSNIGGAILYYKQVYPQARIIGFEPDPAVFPYLQENVARNGLADIKLVQPALAREESTLTFYSDRKSGSFLAHNRSCRPMDGWTTYEVPCVRLRNYLTEPVDFLKMNIEGAEREVLADSEDRLHHVRQMVLEYHHLPGLPRTLHHILALLDSQGFEYLINHFDYETNPALKPPFGLIPETRYYLLIYATRRE